MSVADDMDGRALELSQLDTHYDSFDVNFPLTPVHEFLATLPGLLRDHARAFRPPLIVTTNYDDLMEQALTARNAAFDVIVYMAEGPHEGKLCTRVDGGRLEPIADPRSNVEL